MMIKRTIILGLGLLSLSPAYGEIETIRIRKLSDAFSIFGKDSFNGAPLSDLRRELADMIKDQYERKVWLSESVVLEMAQARNGVMIHAFGGVAPDAAFDVTYATARAFAQRQGLGAPKGDERTDRGLRWEWTQEGGAGVLFSCSLDIVVSPGLSKSFLYLCQIVE